MKIKVCGMSSIEQLEQLDKLEVDFAGFIFYEKSARFVGEKLAQHKSAIANLQLKRVGVFVNEKIEKIEELVKEYKLDYVQLHGDESVFFCKEVEAFAPVIKAIRIGVDTKLEEYFYNYQDACTYFLFDTDSKQYGGTGKKFDWSLLKKVQIPKPFFLSGGIGPKEADELKIFNHPQLFAIDINSRFEIEPGVKNIPIVTEFIKKIHSL